MNAKPYGASEDFAMLQVKPLPENKDQPGDGAAEALIFAAFAMAASSLAVTLNMRRLGTVQI